MRLFLISLLFLPALLTAQRADVERARESVEADLRAALDELARVREEIATERIPLARQRNQLENDLVEQQRAYERLQGQGDNRSVELSALERQTGAKRDELVYVENLLEEFLRSLEAEAHVSELPRLREILAPIREGAAAEEGAALEDRVQALEGAVARLREQVGGARYSGEAVGPHGEVNTGTFALVGPLVYFAADGDGPAGWVEERVGSLMPQVVPLGSGTEGEIRAVASRGEGNLPVDATAGNAVRRAEARESPWEQVRRGGIVMIPILVLALAALVVAVLKWVQIAGMKTAPPETLLEILDDVRHGQKEKAQRRASAVAGPVGELLRAAVQNAHEHKGLVEEILYEKVLEARPRLERFLPFLALTAATAPLLGLLGTVTGMINTFQVITLFGTGDARTLSGGISEALITTKYGLAIAIAALLVHALLSRKAKGVLSGMEQTGTAFLNGLPQQEKDLRG